MRRFAKWLLLALLILPLLALVLLYFILQSQYATDELTNWVAEHSQYRLKVGQISHSLQTPHRLELLQVELSSDEQPTLLVAEKVIINLGWQQLSDPYKLASIVLENGQLTLNMQAKDRLPFHSNQLILKNMALALNDEDLQVEGIQVNAGIAPWQYGNLLQQNSQFQLSANSLIVNGIKLQNSLIQGRTEQGSLILDNLGGDLARGQITGRAYRNTQGDWTINRIHLSNIKWQVPLSITEIIEHSQRWPALKIQSFDANNSSLEGKDWAVSDLNLSISGISITQGEVVASDGEIIFNATDVVYDDLLFNEPIVKLGIRQDAMLIKQFSSRWQGGLLRAKGEWQISTQTLTLSDLVIAGIEYVLPADWRQYYQKTPPAWLKQLNIVRLSANRNVLIDVSPDFPFQITLLDGDGSDLVLVKNQLPGIWSGNLTLNANNATFNKVDLRQPMLTLSADEDHISVSELGALTPGGILEATATITQQAERDFKLTLQGQNAPLSILPLWGWRDIPLSGNANFKLHLQRDSQETSGRLDAVGRNGQELIQTLPEVTMPKQLSADSPVSLGQQMENKAEHDPMAPKT